MPTYFAKPENALKRAEELELLGKLSDAVETLHDTLKGRRHKTWTKTHEAIMLKHLEICVELRRPHLAKDALFQYKSMTQQIAVQSLETVIEHFLSLAEKKTDEAQLISIEKVEEIDDLDQADAPETLLLSTVSGAATKDRMDRTVLAPWLRFLWDSYRNCLELLRNNSQVEQLYHKIARQSFSFCAKYQRRTEFRKLCETLRLHLNQIQKHQHLSHGVKLTSAESLCQMQDTRLIQLDTAIQMELWQEAYRSTEDVHAMMTLSKEKDKRMVKPASYVNYYDKVALVFFKADNRLFHAAALLQKYIIFKDMKKTFTTEEAQDQATRVLLAVVSIGDGAEMTADLSRYLDLEDTHGANIRLLSNLLRLPISPTRQSMLKEIARLNIPEISQPIVHRLYQLLEVNNVSPLRLTGLVEEELQKLQQMSSDNAEGNDLSQYIDSVRSLVASKTLKQLSHLYDSLSLERIYKLIPFYDQLQLERFLVDLGKKRLVQATVDHRLKCVRFGSVSSTVGAVATIEQDVAISQGHEEDIDGVCSLLETFYRKLRSATDILDGNKRRDDILYRLKTYSEIYKYHKQDDYERILARRKRIEQYKEASERLKQHKSSLLEQEQTRKEEKRRQDELHRLEMERLEFERQKKKDQEEERKRLMNRERLKSLKHSVIYKTLVEEHGEENLESLDADILFKEQLAKMNMDMQEHMAKQKAQEKKWDHLVRATHLQEMSEYEAVSREWRDGTRAQWEWFEQDRVNSAIKEREMSCATHAAMQRVRVDALQFLNKVKNERREEFEDKVTLWNKKLLLEKKARLEQRHSERKKRRREQWKREREEAERREKEEAEREQRELEETRRRDRRGAIHGARPEQQSRPDVDSKADADTDWRSSTKVKQVPPQTIQRQDIIGFGSGEEKWTRNRDTVNQNPNQSRQMQPSRFVPHNEDRELERQAAVETAQEVKRWEVPGRDDRRRPEMYSSKAESDTNWRSRDKQPMGPRPGHPQTRYVEGEEKWSRQGVVTGRADRGRPYAAPPNAPPSSGGGSAEDEQWVRQGQRPGAVRQQQQYRQQS